MQVFPYPINPIRYQDMSVKLQLLQRGDLVSIEVIGFVMAKLKELHYSNQFIIIVR